MSAEPLHTVNGTARLYLGDCVEVMRSLPECSVDTVLCDPPYELGFMGKSWDASGVAYQTETWREALRVAKPGALLLAFGGSRTYHRMACAVEDAGWEIRDQIMWVYGSGFPKSLDISKAIDKAKGAEREVVGRADGRGRYDGSRRVEREKFTGIWNGGDIGGCTAANITAPATPLAQLWSGYGTALKPAHEPIVVAMKPLDGTFAENAERWGVAGFNVDGGRVGSSYLADTSIRAAFRNGRVRTGSGETSALGEKDDSRTFTRSEGTEVPGRFPANLIHDGSEEVEAGFPNANHRTGGPARSSIGGGVAYGGGNARKPVGFADSGSASRFFYCAKASRSEREAGCEGLEGGARGLAFKRCAKCGKQPRNVPGSECQCAEPEWREAGAVSPVRNSHPTVKPLALMRYLAKLTRTPTGGVVLDPFMGSGSTGAACALEGRQFIGIEREPEYLEIARRRIAHWAGNPVVEEHAPAPEPREPEAPPEWDGPQATVWSVAGD